MAFGKKRKEQEAAVMGAQLSAHNNDPMSRYSRNSEVYARKKEEILESYSRDNTQNYSHKRAKKGSTGKKVVAGVVSVLVVAALGVGAWLAIFMSEVGADLNGKHSGQEQMDIQEALVSTKSYKEPFYVLLLGSDARVDEFYTEEEDFNGSRTDVNILARVDPVKKVVTMVSIPRDTKIDLPGYGTQKFNAAHAFGGVAGVIREASKLCNVEISHYVEIGFNGVMNMVDAMDGVEVDVPYYINDADAWVEIQPGYQTLSGWDALGFARSRAYADGDFTRTSNQRILIEAIAKKVLNMNLSDMEKTIRAAAKCVDTDMSLLDIFSLAVNFKDGFTMYSIMVPSTTGMIGDASYVFCDHEGLAKIMEAVEAGIDPNTVETLGATGSALKKDEEN